MFVMNRVSRIGAAPVVNDPGDVILTDPCGKCAAAFQTALAGFPASAACLQQDPAHLTYYKNLCCLVIKGLTTQAAANAEWARYVAAHCPPPAQSPQPTPAPTPQRDPCLTMLSAWRTQNPTLDQCLNDDLRHQMVAACRNAQNGKTSQTYAVQRIQQIVNAACARKTTTPPASQPSSPPPVVPPPSPPLPGDSSGNHAPDVSGSTGSQPVAQGKPSALKTWGPVVGIGLVVAMALTAARKRK